MVEQHTLNEDLTVWLAIACAAEEQCRRVANGGDHQHALVKLHDDGRRRPALSRVPSFRVFLILRCQQIQDVHAHGASPWLREDGRAHRLVPGRKRSTQGRLRRGA